MAGRRRPPTVVVSEAGQQSHVLRPVKTVCDVLGVSHSALAVRHGRSARRDGRRARRRDDTDLITEIRDVVAGLPNYSFRHIRGIVRRRREQSGTVRVNAMRNNRPEYDSWTYLRAHDDGGFEVINRRIQLCHVVR